MDIDQTDGSEPPGEPNESATQALDDLIADHAELVRPAVELARQTAAAMRPIQDLMQSPPYRFALEALASPSMRTAMEAAAVQQELARDIAIPAIRTAIELANSRAAAKAAAEGQTIMNQLANSPVARVATELAHTWQRIQNQTASRLSETTQAIQSISQQIRPWIRKVAETTGKTLLAIYRQAAPPNWTNGDTTPLVSYTAAVALALEEGIPLAWVPDYDTVRLLLDVPAGPGRRTKLRAILTDRRVTILDHCQARLDEHASGPNAPSVRRRMIEVVRQSIEALRADLPAPAQSAAANLADHLLRKLFVPIDGKYAYKATSERVTNLSGQFTTLSLPFLSILCELATLMPIPKSLTEWWPDRDMELPDTFSRHATTHAIGEPDQVNTVNALIAIMLAVSLLCQDATSKWTALGTFVWNTEIDNGITGTSAVN